MGLEKRESTEKSDASSVKSNRSQNIRESDRSRIGRGAVVKSEQGQGDISGYEDAIKAAEESDDPDAYKYKLAVEIVDSQIGNEQTLGDNEYRQAIDATFDQMNPTISGSEMRDEDDLLSGAIRGAREVIDDINYGVGTGIDWLWDNSVGNVAGVIGGGLNALLGGDFEDSFNDVKENVSNWVTPETGSMVSDMLFDLGLSAIPGIGVPLAVGKNAIQNSENIFEGITGVDDITGEKLDGGQQIAKLATGIGGTALSAIPGLGKAKNAGKVAEAGRQAVDEIGDAADVAKMLKAGDYESALRAGVKNPNIMTDDMSKIANKGIAEKFSPRSTGMETTRVDYLDAPNPTRMQSAIDDLVQTTESLDKGARTMARANTPAAFIDEAKSVIRNYPGNFKENIKNAGSSMKSAAGELVHGHPLKAAGGARQAIRNVGDAVIPTRTPLNIQTSLAEGVKDPTDAQKIGTMGATLLTSFAPRMATGIGSGLLANYAENGDRAIEALANGIDNELGAAGLPLMMMAFTPGAKRASSWLPNPSGKYGAVSIPRLASTGTSSINYYSSYPFATDEGEVSGDEAAEYIRKAMMR